MYDPIASALIPDQLRQEMPGTLDGILVELALASFACSNTGVLLMDTECNVLMGSPTLAQRLGHDPAAFRQTNLQALLHPGELLLCMHHLSQLIAGQSDRYEAELRWMRTDGETVWMSVNAFRLGQAETGPSYIYMQTQDITERKTAEEALTEALVQRTTLLETITDAYVMISRGGEFLYVNRHAERLLRHNRDNLLGHKIRTVMPEWIKSGFYKTCQRALEEATPIYLQDYYTSFDRWLDISCYPCKQGLMIFMRDITPYKEQEEALHATKQQLNSMIDHAADNIAILDGDFRLTQINKAFIETFGYSEDELLGQRPANIPEELWIESELLFRQALQGRQISGFETKRQRKDGLLLDLSMTISPVVGTDQEIIGICIIGRDISERRKTEELLRNSEKLSMAGQLAAGVAHEIRNPLTSLKGFTQFMKTGAQYKEEYLDIMMSELTRIEQIISELLLLAKPQSTAYLSRPVGSILEQVVSLLEPQANLSNVQVRTHIPAELPHVVCEENQLKQVFINIVKNSIEAMPHGGQIRISAELERPGTLLIAFRDEGPGVPADVLKRLGEPFFTTKENGSGLGLMVSQKIVTEHHGRLDIESEAGIGTTVTISLPV